MSGDPSPAAPATSALRSRALAAAYGCRIRHERSTFGLRLQTTLPEFTIEISERPTREEWSARRAHPERRLIKRRA
jgi:hypothetical protein